MKLPFSSDLKINFLNSKNSISIYIYASGNLLGWPKTFPTNLSFRVIDGSNYNPTPINPPGIAYNS